MFKSIMIFGPMDIEMKYLSESSQVVGHALTDILASRSFAEGADLEEN